MKKKTIIIIAIIIALIIGVLICFTIKKVNAEKRNYEIARITEYKYFVLKENDKYGVIDKQGNIIVEAKYDSINIPNPEKAVFVCYEGEKTIVLNEMSQEIFTEYENIETLRLKDISSDLVYEKTTLKYQKDGKYGIINLDGKKLTDPIYESIDTLQFKEGELLVKLNGKYGVINIKGATLVKPEYDEINADRYYQESTGYKNSGYIVSRTTDEGYRYGYVNLDGKEIINTIYNELYRIVQIESDDIYIIVSKDGKYGVLKNGEQIVNTEYVSLIYNENNRTITALKGKKYGVLSLNGNIIVPFEYNQIDTTGDYLYATGNDSNVVVYDKNGQVVNMDKDLKILNTENENYKIHIESNDKGTEYSIYSNGKVTQNEYSYIQYLFNNYFIAVNKNGDLGIIDDNGEIKLDFIYSSIQKIDGTKLVETINSKNETTEIYSEDMNKLYELNNANVEYVEDYFKLYNDEKTIYFSQSGEQIDDIESVLKKPTHIGKYTQVIYGNGEIYYTNNNIE